MHTASPSPVDLQQLVSALGDAIVIADAGGKIIVWNPAAERIFGYAQGEALGNSLDIITLVLVQHHLHTNLKLLVHSLLRLRASLSTIKANQITSYVTAH